MCQSLRHAELAAQLSVRSVSRRMTLLSRLLRRPPLVGTWRQTDDPNISMVFFPDGRLEYRTIEGDVVQIMRLTYRIDGSEIVSNQPSAPREERSAFRMEGSTLVLNYSGEETSYKRAG